MDCLIYTVTTNGKLSLELYYIYKITQNIADKLQMDLKLKVKKKKI